MNIFISKSKKGVFMIVSMFIVIGHTATETRINYSLN